MCIPSVSTQCAFWASSVVGRPALTWLRGRDRPSQMVSTCVWLPPTRLAGHNLYTLKHEFGMVLPQDKHTAWACQKVSLSKQAAQTITKWQGHSVFKVSWKSLAWSGLPHGKASPAKVVLSDQRLKYLQGNSCLSRLLGGQWHMLQKVGSGSEQRTFLTQKAVKYWLVVNGASGISLYRNF
jgi:hypothetical protein